MICCAAAVRPLQMICDDLEAGRCDLARLSAWYGAPTPHCRATGSGEAMVLAFREQVAAQWRLTIGPELLLDEAGSIWMSCVHRQCGLQPSRPNVVARQLVVWSSFVESPRPRAEKKSAAPTSRALKTAVKQRKGCLMLLRWLLVRCEGTGPRCRQVWRWRWLSSGGAEAQYGRQPATPVTTTPEIDVREGDGDTYRACAAASGVS